MDKYFDLTLYDRCNYLFSGRYRRLHISEDQDHIQSSVHRTARIEAMPLAHDRASILTILGDTTDKAFPIYRYREKDGSSTLATGELGFFLLTRINYNPCMDK